MKKQQDSRLKMTDTRHQTTRGESLLTKKLNKTLSFNLIETYFTLGYVRLSSISRNPKDEENKDKELKGKNQKTLKFELKIEGLAEKLYKELTIIEDIHAIDVLKWCKEVEEIVTINKWNKNIQAAILKQLIKDETFAEEILKDSWKETQQELIKKVYPKEEQRLYKKRLQNIYQTQFVSIQEYVTELKKNVNILQLMCKLRDSEAQNMLSEAFYNGLGKYTYGKVIEQNLESFEDCLEYLTTIELRVTTRSKEIEENSIKRYTFDGKCEGQYYKQDKKMNKKYCKLHKFGNHTTEECTKYDKDFYKKKIDKNNEEKNLLIREKAHNPSKTAVQGEIDNKEVEVNIDSGASKSYISQKKATSLGLKEIESETIIATFGNNSTEVTNRIVEIEIGFPKLTRKVKEAFYVLEKLPEDFLLGNEFLFNNEVVIDYKNKAIIIDREVIPMINKEESDIEEMDRILYERLLHIEDKKMDDDTEVKAQLTKYMKDNDTFKAMNIKPVELFIEERLKDCSLTPKYYSVPLKYERGARQEIKRLLETDVIEQNRATYASPAFLLEKKNKELRLVVDYRAVNNFIKDEISMIPKIFESIYKFGKSRIFSKLDLKNGFNQIRLAENSRDITSFTIFGQQYRYKRIPFGIKSGPKLFQCTINKILEGIDNCIVYIDDIVVYAESMKEHNKTLLEVLSRLREFKVKINFEKSMFAIRKLEILGNIIESGIIKIDTGSIDKIITKDYKTNSKKDIQKIIGIITWYRNFIPDVSRRILSITRLLNNKNKESWGEEQTKVLNEIKEDIKYRAQLKLPDFTKTFKIQCDASEAGMGAVLFQDHGVISYYSKKFNDVEKNYSIVEKEMFAIIKTLEFYRILIQGFSVQIETDSRNCIFENKVISKRIERWKLVLNEFNIKLKNIKGIENNIADSLSRCFLIKNKKNELTTLGKQIKEFLLIKDNEPLRDEKGRCLVKDENIEEFVKAIHEFGVHMGMTSLYRSIKDRYYLRNIKKNIKKVLMNCKVCLRCKKKRRKKRMYKIMANGESEIVCSDVFGPFETGDYDMSAYRNASKGYFLTVTDIFSRYTEVFFLTQVTTKRLISKFEKWIRFNGCPKTIICDNGKQYTSKEFERYLKNLRINKISTPIYHPASNGISERLNQAIAEVLRMFKGQKIELLRQLIMARLNFNFHRGIWEEPIAIKNGYSQFEYNKEYKRHIPQTVENNSEQKYKNSNEDYNEIKVMDKVLIRNFNGNKLADLYIGPFQIEVVSEGKLWYKIKGRKEWIHWDHIKLYKKHEEK